MWFPHISTNSTSMGTSHPPCHPLSSPGNTMKWTWVAWRRASPSRSLPAVRRSPRINVRSFRSGSWLTTPCPGLDDWVALLLVGMATWGKSTIHNGNTENFHEKSRERERERGEEWWRSLARVGRFWEGGNNMKEVEVDSGFIGGFRIVLGWSGSHSRGLRLNPVFVWVEERCWIMQRW